MNLPPVVSEEERQAAGRRFTGTHARRPNRFKLTPCYDQLLDQVSDGRDADSPLRRRDEC